MAAAEHYGMAAPKHLEDEGYHVSLPATPGSVYNAQPHSMASTPDISPPASGSTTPVPDDGRWGLQIAPAHASVAPNALRPAAWQLRSDPTTVLPPSWQSFPTSVSRETWQGAQSEATGEGAATAAPWQEPEIGEAPGGPSQWEPPVTAPGGARPGSAGARRVHRSFSSARAQSYMEAVSDSGNSSSGHSSGSSGACSLRSLENVIATGSHMEKALEIAPAPQKGMQGGFSEKRMRPPECRICNEEVGLDEKTGDEFVACECEAPICQGCYVYLRNNEHGACPFCKNLLRKIKGVPGLAPELVANDFIEDDSDDEDGSGHPKNAGPKDPLLGPAQTRLSIEGPPPKGGVGQEMAVLDTSEFAREGTQRRYDVERMGVGTVLSPERVSVTDDGSKPFSRRVPIGSSLINPYRVMVVARFFVMAGFLAWRGSNPNSKAWVLWLISVVCEVWFGISWIFDQVPKWSPVNRETYLDRLSQRYDRENEPSDLAPIDLFVSTADPEKEPPLVTANVVLSILAADYPVDKVACYISDDGAAMLTYDAIAETAGFARMWLPFCKQYQIEPRAPDMYFQLKSDVYLKGQLDPNFVRARRHMKREYEEFKIRINALVARERPKDGWVMADGNEWPGNNRSNHRGIVQVFLQPHGDVVDVEGNVMPWLVYVSREKRPQYDHNKKAGAMNALIRASGLITNAPYILNLDCDHYVNYSKAFREAMCFMMDPLAGADVCYVQFPQRFDGIDGSDRYANHNTVFYDVNLKGLDGVQGPVYVGTGCCFRRQALYGNVAPIVAPVEEARKRMKLKNRGGLLGCCCPGARPKPIPKGAKRLSKPDTDRPEDEMQLLNMEHGAQYKFGPCSAFCNSTFERHGGFPAPRDPLEVLSDVILVISAWYEEQTLWGKEVGWIYGSITEDIVTGFVMHCRGWRSVYCMTKRPAFKGTAPINMTDRLNQVLRWGLGSVEICFSRHNPIFFGWDLGRIKFVQRLAYINTAIYPFTSIMLFVYCLVPAACLVLNQFIMPTINTTAVLLFLAFFITIFGCALLEVRWSGVELTEYWRNEQFWVIGGTSAHLAAVWQGLLKVVAGVQTRFTLTQKDAGDVEGEFAELYIFRWTWLVVPPLTIIVANLVAIGIGAARALNEENTNWSQLVGKVFFSLWVLMHLYPFARGLMGRHRSVPPIIVIWFGLLVAALGMLYWSLVDKNNTTTAEEEVPAFDPGSLGVVFVPGT